MTTPDLNSIMSDVCRVRTIVRECVSLVDALDEALGSVEQVLAPPPVE